MRLKTEYTGVPSLMMFVNFSNTLYSTYFAMCAAKNETHNLKENFKS